LPDPLLNFSQEKCSVPVDNVPPCPPTLSVSTNCEQVENQLNWTDPDPECAPDVRTYNIWYAALADADFTLLASQGPATNTSYLHIDLSGIAGCYMISAVDSSGNESDYSNKVCIDIDTCPTYHLPNVFTPNNDLTNDLFRPFPYTSVERIDLKIFNRWGTVVFETNDPEINWDGKNMQSHADCSEGVYFYVCDVYEYRLNGLSKRLLTGPLHLLRK
jgi:gliding motility-associated-like protein